MLSVLSKIQLYTLVVQLHHCCCRPSYPILASFFITVQEGMDFIYMMTESESMVLSYNDNYNEDHKNRDAVPGFNKEGFTAVARAKPIQPTIWRHAPLTHRPTTELEKGPHLPIWESFPPPRSSFTVNYNLKSEPIFEELVNLADTTRTAVLSGVMDNMVLFGAARTTEETPKSVVFQPVFDHFKSVDNGGPIVGYIIVDFAWDSVFHDVLNQGAAPLVGVLRSSCGDAYTYKVEGPIATFLGVGDLHDPKFDYLEVTSYFGIKARDNAANTTEDAGVAEVLASVCEFSLHMYPTDEMYDVYHTQGPKYITMVVVGIFVFTTLVFLLYDFLQQRQQSTLAATANKTTALISKLFPQEVHDRLFQSELAAQANERNTAPKFKMLNMVHKEEEEKERLRGEIKKKDKPIADLFPDCTVLFCDISGFTAWSSIRNPTQVFQLLEAVYTAFDAIAHRRGVFKVETIGDCYLAVTGLPTPRDDHAVAMVRFAHDCLVRMRVVAEELTLELGPGTEELTMRFGLHSGPVTAGVLRGEKTRFQLFGDTVNTASRMESTGLKDKIQISQATADLLIAAGKEKWLIARDTKVQAKGKGELQTYWACPKKHHHGDSLHNASDHVANPDASLGHVGSSRQLHEAITSVDGLDQRKMRSVQWIAEIMVKMLKQIAARRTASGWTAQKRAFDNGESNFFQVSDATRVVDEVQDVITLPAFDQKVARKYVDPETIKIPEDAVSQLHNYIARVAMLYR